MRFLMWRRNAPVPVEARIVHVPVDREERLVTVLQKLRKEAYHVLIVKDRSGRWQPLPEEALFRRFFDDKKPDSRIGDLIA